MSGTHAGAPYVMACRMYEDDDGLVHVDHSQCGEFATCWQTWNDAVRAERRREDPGIRPAQREGGS